MRKRIQAKKHDDGFTLIELLIVIVILGVLAGIVVFGVAQFRTDSQTAACEADLKTVNVAADAYDAKEGNYPDDIDLLIGDGYLVELADKEEYSFNVGGKTVTRTC